MGPAQRFWEHGVETVLTSRRGVALRQRAVHPGDDVAHLEGLRFRDGVDTIAEARLVDGPDPIDGDFGVASPRWSPGLGSASEDEDVK